MDYSRIWELAEMARRRQRFSPADRRVVSEELPALFPDMPEIRAPARLRHPAGFTVSGASVRTFLRAALLLAARGALGPDYHKRSRFYAGVESDLTLRISLSHFRHDDPKGAYCCPACTLAMLPLYRGRVLHWFDGRELELNVRGLLARRDWRFARKVDPRLVAWATGT